VIPWVIRRLLPMRPSASHLLAGLALLLGLLAVWPWVSPISAALPAPGASETATPPVSVAALPPQAALTAIGERPLFSPTRRPSAIARTRPAAGAATRYRLLGLITVGAVRRALVADGSRRVEIGEGGTLDSWSVARIGQDQVVLSSAEGEIVLTLRPASVDPPPAGAR
jgi:hypothetical protein